jgi:uncharacterized coiled-coil DUF342 family protein
MEELRKMRNSLVEKMREHKRLRDEYREQAKSLIATKKKQRDKMRDALPKDIASKDKSGKKLYPTIQRELEAAKAELKMLEIKQQTDGTLTAAKEKELLERIKSTSENIKRLEKLASEQTVIIEETKALDADINILFASSNEEHEKVLRLSEESQKVHEQYVALSKEVTHLIEEANKKHQNF